MEKTFAEDVTGAGIILHLLHLEVLVNCDRLQSLLSYDLVSKLLHVNERLLENLVEGRISEAQRDSSVHCQVLHLVHVAHFDD